MSIICKLSQRFCKPSTYQHDRYINLKFTTPNTDGWGNLLVTVFAVPYLDRFLLNNNFKCQTISEIVG